MTRGPGPSSPPPCWRPYADTSPFNQPIPRDARVAPNSSRIVRRLLGFGRAAAAHRGRRRARRRTPDAPIYFNDAHDPVFSVHCTRPWGTCPVEGLRVRIPDAARVPGGTDGHLSVVDPRPGGSTTSGACGPSRRGGGRLIVAWGGRTRIDGDGLGSYAVAARFGTLAGALRAEELQAGRSTMPSPSACAATRAGSSIRRGTADGPARRRGCPAGTRRRWARAFSSR